jgi:hypothetical protein
MARNRTPTTVARVTGRDIKDPKRLSDRVDPPVNALGNPPARLTSDEMMVWADIADDMPWLAGSDRGILEIACKMTVKVSEPGCPMGYFTQLRLCLSSMGGTPVDRSRVSYDASDEGKNPTAEFFN